MRLCVRREELLARGSAMCMRHLSVTLSVELQIPQGLEQSDEEDELYEEV